MIELLKRILIITTSLTIGFGLWYLIVWLFVNNPNPFEWTLFSKVVYLFMSYVTTETTRDFLMRNQQ